jgi:uncharacterized membrane protein
VKANSANLKKIGDDKGVIIAVAVALVIVFGVVGGYYLLFRPAPEGYTTIYVLDAHDTLIVNQNYTFNVGVVNHMGESLNCEVQLKVTNETISIFPANIVPINTYTKTLANGETWETQVTVTLHETGSHSIIFELWTRNDAGDLKFTGNADVRNVEAVNQP